MKDSEFYCLGRLGAMKDHDIETMVFQWACLAIEIAQLEDSNEKLNERMDRRIKRFFRNVEHSNSDN